MNLAAKLIRARIEMEGMVASLNKDLCGSCRICEHRCPCNAIEIKEKAEKVTAYIIEALCKGCGVYEAAYPTKAITSGHFTTEEIMT